MDLLDAKLLLVTNIDLAAAEAAPSPYATLVVVSKKYCF